MDVEVTAVEERTAAPRDAAATWASLSAAIVRYREVAIILAVTGGAAFVRLWHLTTMPWGFHNDEGNVILDARDILAHGWIGPYSLRALGYPIAVNYYIAPFVQYIGDTVLSVRLPIAILGIISVPLIYGVGRMAAGWRTGACAAVLLAFSLWHMHLSRVGFPVMGWSVSEIGALLCLQLGLRRQRWPWFVGAGLLIGVGVWIYNSAFLFAVAAASYLIAWYVIRNAGTVRAALHRPFHLPVGATRELLLLLILLASTVFAASPIIHYAVDHRATYQGHFNSAYIFNRPEHKNDSLPEKVRVTEHNVKRLFWALTTTARADGADGLGTTPPVGTLTMGIAIIGAMLALFRLRDPALGIGLLLVPLLMVSTAMTLDGQYRRVFGLLPVIALFGGLALGTVWQWADTRGVVLRVFGVGLVAVILVTVSYHNISYYFRDYGDTSNARFVFFPEMREASEYLDAHGHPYVYFYNDRASLGHESRRVLAPDIAGGEERSTEFGPKGYTLRYDLKPEETPSFAAKREPDGAVFLFMGKYVKDADEVAHRYPGGQMSEVDTERLHVVDYRAYYLPPDLLELYTAREHVEIPVKSTP